MKNTAILIIATLFTAVVYSQSSETKYCCPKCDYCSSKAETCPNHKIALEASATDLKYCCSKCDWTIPPVKGQCPHSTTSLMKEGTLYCVYCHDLGGKCKKCGMEMMSIEIKKRKN